MGEYKLDGDNTPIVKGSALKALENPNDAEAVKCIAELMEACDYLSQPERAIDKPFLMPVEDVFSITGRGTVGTGRINQVRLKLVKK